MQDIIIIVHMKKSILTVIFGCVFAVSPFVAITAGGDSKSGVTIAKPEDSFAKIQFDKTSVDLGKFPASDPVRKCSFTFTNTGTAPLVIHQALASCGCTVPSYPKDPIKPGEKAKIEVTYNGTGKFPGHFQKTITVRSNATNEVVRLTLVGDMTE